jgi:serine/threonine protein kinase
MGIAANGDLKMFDFGLAQYYPGHVAGSGINLPQSKARGTLRYMAPETLRKEPLFNESADIYSFAIVFVELLSRENPYREYEGDVNAFLAAARMETGLRPAICTMFPKAHRRLLEHSWHEDKSFRPTARQLCSALHQMPTVCWV